MKYLILMLVAIAFAFPCSGQLLEEDVVLLKDGTIFRGTITHALTPGSAVTIEQHSGKVSALLWREILVVRRLPEGIPDSVFLRYFSTPLLSGKMSSAHQEPDVELTGYGLKEDVVFLKDKSMIRGVKFPQTANGYVGVWVDGVAEEIPASAVLKVATVKRGLPDSLLFDTYVEVPEEWKVQERRIFSFFGGWGVATGELLKSNGLKGPGKLRGGMVVGMEMGIRIVNGIRWLTTSTFSFNRRSTIRWLNEFDGVPIESGPALLWMLMTGVEARTFGPAELEVRGIIQVGYLSLEEEAYVRRATEPMAYAVGTPFQVDPVSTVAFGVCLGGGIVYNRLTFDVRWHFSRVQYALHAYVSSTSSEDDVYKNNEKEMIHVFMFTLGVSVF